MPGCGLPAKVSSPGFSPLFDGFSGFPVFDGFSGFAEFDGFSVSAGFAATGSVTTFGILYKIKNIFLDTGKCSHFSFSPLQYYSQNWSSYADFRNKRNIVWKILCSDFGKRNYEITFPVWS